MYDKNLSKDMHLRVSEKDMEFLQKLADERNVTVSEVIRSMIGEYRRSLDAINIFADAFKLIKEREEKGEELSNGDIETNINNKL